MEKISDKRLLQLLFSHQMFGAGRLLLDSFLSVYIWKQTNDLAAVGWFFLIVVPVNSLVFTLLARHLKNGKRILIQTIGLIIYIVVYASIFFLGESAIQHLYLIAFILGLGSGFYWSGYHLASFDFTTEKNRGNYQGVVLAGKILLGIVVPAMGGFVISKNFFGAGTANAFALGALFFCISLLLISKIKDKELKKRKVKWKKSLALFWKNKDVVKMMASYLIGGSGRKGSLDKVLIPLLIFDATKSELELGLWLSVFAIISAASSWIIGRHFHYRHYKKVLLAGGILFVLIIGLLLSSPSLVVYAIFGAVRQIAAVLLDLPKSVISGNLIHTLDDFKSHRVEYITVRSWSNAGIGRAISYGLIILAGGILISNLKYILVWIAIATVIEVFLMLSIKFKLEARD